MGTRGVALVVGAALGIGASAAGTVSASAPPQPPPTTEPQPTPFVHPADVHNPDCVIEIQPGSSLSLIAEAMPDTAVTYTDLQAENGIGNADYVQAGDYLDICVGNEVNDITGGAPVRGNEAAVIVDEEVAEQQRKLNQLFDGYGISQLLVDGISGPITRRMLCAFRSAFGMPASRADMVPGSAEEQQLMAATALPPQSPDAPSRWVVIDKSCQVIFAGERDRFVFVFPTSTGEEGYETRDLDGVRAFRYDPAAENDGWHNSTTYPAEIDNPLNGNMYKPIYFHRGQAIHGSYNVPPEPRSKGCARLMVEHQDLFVDWLGLGDATRAIWESRQIDLIVHVKGDF